MKGSRPDDRPPGRGSPAHLFRPEGTVAGDLVVYPHERDGIYDGNGGIIDSPDWGRKSLPPPHLHPHPLTKEEWKDGEALFLRASVWREFAEHVAGSLTKGSRVIAQGRLKQRSYETKEGEKRTSIELDIDEIGPSLRYATASITRAQSSRGPGGAPGGAVEEPWAASAPSDDAAAD